MQHANGNSRALSFPPAPKLSASFDTKNLFFSTYATEVVSL